LDKEWKGNAMARCRECDKEFIQNTVRQEFCDDYCRGAYHRRRYRQQAVEEAEDRREARMNGHGTPEQRKKASEVVARIVERGQGRMVRRI
jgi:hypothetical protein